MLSYHNEVEEQFYEVLRTIPLENDDGVFSPKLYNILQNSSVQVENMLRLLCDKFELHYGNQTKFPVYYKLLNKDNIFKIQRLFLIKKQNILYPFEMLDDLGNPFWWSAYNRSKHKLPDGFKEGNLKNTLYALGASYAIHCMAHYARYAPNDFLDSKRWQDAMASFNDDGELIKNDFTNLPKSNLFYYASAYIRGAQL